MTVGSQGLSALRGVQTGPRGGRYTVTSSGRRRYLGSGETSVALGEAEHHELDDYLDRTEKYERSRGASEDQVTGNLRDAEQTYVQVLLSRREGAASSK